MHARTVGFVLLCVSCVAAPVVADDWPQFRGPQRDGTSKETGWLSEWPKDGLPELWKVNVGRGYSTVAVVKDRVYTLGLVLQDPEKKDSFQEVLRCLNVENGKTSWEFVCTRTLDKSFPGSRSTPTIEGKHAFVYAQGGELYCLNAETGEVVWQKHLMKELAAQPVTYGYAASPLIVDNMVIVPARILKDKPTKDVTPTESALLVAFDKTKGTELWRAYHPSAAIGGGYWACPTYCKIDDKPLLVFSCGNAVLGLEPATGKILWKHAFSEEDLKTKLNKKGITGQEVAVVGNRLFACIHPDNSDGLGVCLEVNGTEVKEVWRDKLLDHYSCSNIVWKGHVFGITHNDTTSKVGPLYCLDVKTGKKKWEKSDLGGAFTLVDGKFLCFTGQQVVLVEASTEEFKELGRSQKLFKPEESTFRYSDRVAPVLSNGRLYCRNQNGFLVCLDVRGKGK